MRAAGQVLFFLGARAAHGSECPGLAELWSLKHGSIALTADLGRVFGKRLMFGRQDKDTRFFVLSSLTRAPLKWPFIIPIHRPLELAVGVALSTTIFIDVD